MPATIEIFCCYAREDQNLMKSLRKHLMPLQRRGLITIWSDTDIDAGTAWEDEIKKHLDSAHIILLLISPDFMASDFCYSTEMERALERNVKGEARVIPIILRPTAWKGAPFDKLQMLPTNAKPVTDRRSWQIVDEALNDVTEQITPVVTELLLPLYIDEAEAYLKKGRHADALATYERALRLEPYYIAALYGKAETLFLLDRFEESLAVYDKAIEASRELTGNVDSRFYYGKASALHKLQRYEESLASFDQALSLNPGHADAWYYKGTLLSELKRYEEAIGAFDHVLSLAPNYADAWFHKGISLNILGRIGEAIEALDHALNLEPSKVEALYYKGALLDTVGRYEEAIASFDQALSVNPEDTHAWTRKGAMLVELKRFDEALACLDRALSLDSRLADALALKGFVYRVYKRYEEAIFYIDQAISLNPGYVYAYQQRGSTHADLRQYQQAISDLDQAIKINPNLPETYYSLGNIYLKIKDYQAAIANFEQAIKLNPEYSLAYLERGWAYTDMKQYEIALADFNHAIELSPLSSVAFYSRGVIFTTRRDYQRAIMDFDRAIELDSALVRAYVQRGEVYRLIEEYESAIKDFNSALVLDPTDAGIFNLRGFVYQELQEYEKAIVDYSHAIELDPNHIEAYLNRGLTYAKLQDYSHAITDFDHAIQLDPNDAMAYYIRGNAYGEIKEYEQAIKDYNRAIELDPKLVEAYSTLSSALALLHQWEQAATVARSIEDTQYRSLALNNLALALINAQEWELASSVSVAIEDREARAEALFELSKALAQIQQFERAEAVASMVEDTKIKEDILVELGRQLSKAQQWERTETIVFTLTDSRKRAGLLTVLSAELVRVQQWERAKVIWTEAEKAIQTIEDSKIRLEILRELSRQQNEMATTQPHQELSIKYDIFLNAPMELVTIGGHFEVAVYLSIAGSSDGSDTSKYLLDIRRDEAVGSELSLFLIAPPGFKLEGENVASLPLDSYIGEESTTAPPVPQVAHFNLIALRPGTAKLTVELYRGATFETTLEAEVQVAKIDQYEKPKVGVAARPRPVLQPDLILQVQMDWKENDDAYAFRYTFNSLRASLPIAHKDDFSSEFLPIGWIERVRSLLGSALEDTDGSQPEDICSRLISLGQYLFQILLPLELQQEIRNLAHLGNMFTLLILADQDSWLPWELLHDGQAFLSERFLIGRWPRELDDTRPYEFPVGAVNVAYYAGIKQPEQWVDLFELPGVPHPQLLEGGVFRSIDEAEEMRALYLIRYGQVKGLSSQNDAPVLQNGTGGNRNVEHEVRSSKLSLRRNRPLVNLGYVNAGQAELTLLEQAWAPTFVRAGCSAFVGPLWAVRPSVEEAFVSTFYSHLWAGHSLGDAFRIGRILARAAAPDSLDWLAYVLFGDPMARPYRPVEGQGYAVVEPIGREIDDPLPPGVPARFRVSLRRMPPVWHEERVIEVASELAFNNLQVHVMAFGLQVIPTPPIAMVQTPTDDYLGWFSLVAPFDTAGDEQLVQVYFVAGRKTIHTLSFSLKIAVSGGGSR